MNADRVVPIVFLKGLALYPRFSSSFCCLSVFSISPCLCVPVVGFPNQISKTLARRGMIFCNGE
jgi:hypothetical protein